MKPSAEPQKHNTPQGASFTIEHIAGCLGGGVVGDALEAEVRYSSERAQFSTLAQVDCLSINGMRGGLSWHSQMTLFTAEGLIRAKRRMESRGFCDIGGVLLHAYYRWLACQKQALPTKASAPTETTAGLARSQA